MTLRPDRNKLEKIWNDVGCLDSVLTGVSIVKIDEKLSICRDRGVYGVVL